MTDERCSCCDLPSYSCGSAAVKQEKLELDARRTALLSGSKYLMARFPGRCGSCQEWTVQAGDPIIAVDGLGWVGALCCDAPSSVA